MPKERKSEAPAAEAPVQEVGQDSEYEAQSNSKACFMLMQLMFLLGYFTLMVLMAYHAFSPTDPNSCYYMPGLDAPAAREEDLLQIANALKIEVKQDYPVDMARVFRIWFVWGFWITFIPFFLFIILFVITIVVERERFSRIGCQVLCSLTTLSLTAWIGVGILWRFSKPGTVVAGDLLKQKFIHSTNDELIKEALRKHGYQLDSGKFMRNLIWVGIPSFFLVMFASLVCLAGISSKEQAHLNHEQKKADELPRYHKQAKNHYQPGDRVHTYQGLQDTSD